MNWDWVASPVWLIINSLVSFRLTRLWVADKLPPLPEIRDAIQRWAEGRQDAKLRAAITADRQDPAWIADADAAGKRALRGGYSASTPVGTREDAVSARARLYDNQPPLAYLVTCAWCSGFWISLGVVLAASLIPASVWVFLALPLALSAVVGLLSQLAE